MQHALRLRKGAVLQEPSQAELLGPGNLGGFVQGLGAEARHGACVYGAPKNVHQSRLSPLPGSWEQ